MRLRIATFNLESLDDAPNLDPPLAQRVAALRPMLLRLNADLLCLQEVNGQSPEGHRPRRLLALDALLGGTPLAGFHRVATQGPHGAPADRHNLVLLSRWPIEQGRPVHHDLVQPPLFRPSTATPASAAAMPVEWDRPILHARIALPGGRRLDLLNLHLRAPLAAPVAGQKRSSFVWRSTGGWAEGFYIAAMKRTGQALEARLLVDRLFDADPDALIAVAGDLNAEAFETPVRVIQADTEDTGNPGLAGRVLSPVEAGVSAPGRLLGPASRPKADAGPSASLAGPEARLRPGRNSQRGPARRVFRLPGGSASGSVVSRPGGGRVRSARLTVNRRRHRAQASAQPE